MKILVIGPSETKARGGMSAVIRGIHESETLNQEFTIDIFPSYIDGSLIVRLFYSVYGYLRFLFCYKQYDLFHIHTAERGSTFRKNFYLRKVKEAEKKAIIQIHGAEYLTFYDRLKGRRKQIVDSFFQQADMVLALSEGWKQELRKRFDIHDCEILNNGVDISAFQEAATEPEDHRNAFLMLGRLGERKGVYDLIEAVEIAVSQNPEITICLAGDGEVEKVRTLVKEKGLEKHITVPGWIDEKQKLEYMKNASTVVLASYHEGLPICILEGMAAGKAIISTKVGAIPEVIAKENGILVMPGDVRMLADSILQCSSNLEMLHNMSQKNREKAENNFDVRHINKQLADYYRKVMK